MDNPQKVLKDIHLQKAEIRKQLNELNKAEDEAFKSLIKDLTGKYVCIHSEGVYTRYIHISRQNISFLSDTSYCMTLEGVGFCHFLTMTCSEYSFSPTLRFTVSKTSISSISSMIDKDVEEITKEEYDKAFNRAIDYVIKFVKKDIEGR